MKIVSLIAENVKKLVAVEIKPDGNLVQITGKNAQGKSSILDSIWWALAGASHIQAVPIRNGENEARIRLDLGEIKVTRTFRRGEEGKHTTSIMVESADGARYQSPQKMLDDLLGELSFDPLAFARKDPKEQFAALQRFVPEVDFDELARMDRGDRELRTELGRKVKQERGAAAAIAIPEGLPAEPVDEEAIVSELQSAGEFNTTLEKRRANRATSIAELETVRRGIQAIQDEIAHKQQMIEQLEERGAALQERRAAAESLPSPKETSQIRERLQKARDVNLVCRKRVERDGHAARAVQIEKQIAGITETIAARQAAKEASIAAASMPVPGIGFGDGSILLNGLPFDQASDAEQLRASVAIAMALNPKLRVIRIRDGSLLDEDGIGILAEMAALSDFQVWIEKVDSSGNVGFVLEDGHVRNAQAIPEALSATA